MSNDLVIWTLDWVPEMPRGFVRDLRLRWACEEAGLPYSVRTVGFEDRGVEHYARQPFGQVPVLQDGDLIIHESGAGLLYISEKSEALMPADPRSRTQVTSWVMSALNSIEIVSVSWWLLKISGQESDILGGWLEKRLEQLASVLKDRTWLVADRFTVADLLMADALRVPQVRELAQHQPIIEYLDRVLERPAFIRAHADQIAHFSKADAARSTEGSGPE